MVPAATSRRVTAVKASVNQTLLREWIALQYTDPKSSEYEQRFAAFEPVWDMTHKQPQEAWYFILAVMETDGSDRIMQSLSAGPLEDLLVYHGPALIDQVEATAKTSPKFASLLGGVWQNAMRQDIWDRVCAIRDRRGWDGIPKGDTE
jgi:hypothetical protein